MGGGEPCGTNEFSYAVELAGEGNAAHMGNFTMAAAQCYDGNTGCAEGTLTLAAANGDMLHEEYAVCFSGFEFPYTTFEGPGAVVGGTGRFENATGSLYSVVIQNQDPDSSDYRTGTNTASGTITY